MIKWIVKSFRHNSAVEEYLNTLDEGLHAVRHITETKDGYTVFVQDYSDYKESGLDDSGVPF